MVDDILKFIDSTMVIKLLNFHLDISLSIRYEEDICLFLKLKLCSKISIDLMALIINCCMIYFHTTFKFNAVYFSNTEIVSKVLTYSYLR